jgi:hypothetical protein
MRGQEARLIETLLMPNSIIASRHDAARLLYHKLYDQTPLTRKCFVVMVKYSEQAAFIVTAFFRDREKKETLVWTRQ